MAAPPRARRATITKVTHRPGLARLVVATRGDPASVGALHLAAHVAKRDSAAVMALGAYLVTEEVRSLLHPQERHVVSASVLAPLPPELSAHRVPGGDNVDHAAAHTASAG